MPQQPSTFLLRGGLNLVIPPIAIPPGMAIAAINYAPDVNGYTSHGGYERFDGHPRPSDSSNPTIVAARRAAISAVPGSGPVRGVQVFQNSIYAFRDQVAGGGGMFKSTGAGWVQQTFGYILEFDTGVTEFLEGEVVTGGTSAANATIDRVVVRSEEGAWDGTASGYLVISNVSGTFVAEALTSSSGAANGLGAVTAITLPEGGKYDFTTHNFYGAAFSPRLYFVNGVGNANEWSGTWLAPIRTGVSAGSLSGFAVLMDATGADTILSAASDSIVMPGEYDLPSFISHYKEHLFLGFPAGSLVNSSIGEPLQYLAITGAGETAMGEAVTGLLTSASTALMVFGNTHVEYITGSDSSDFARNPLSDSAGAVAYTTQMMASPTYLDDGGIRNATTTAAFGGWVMGTLSQVVEPLVSLKKDTNVTAVASMRVKRKNQYRLFYDDGSGLTMYLGRKAPEILPFKLPIDVFCACSGEVDVGLGDRLFVGAEDGFVYELDRGTSFDGAPIQAYIRLPFNSIESPFQEKRYHKSTLEVSSPDPITIGVVFDVDYGMGLGGAQEDVDVAAGAAMVTSELYSSITWSTPVQGRLEHHIDGIGPNIAITYITELDDARPHTLSAQILNYSPRGLKR